MALYYRLIGADIIGLIISSFLLVLLLHNDVMEKKKSKRFIFVTVLTILIIVVEIIANMVDCFPSSNRRMEAYLLNVFGFFLMYFLTSSLSGLKFLYIFNKSSNFYINR